MELDRHDIERTDFATARRGYDPNEVDRHLRAIADSVDELKRREPASPSTAGAAADQVRGILEAAERSAAEIQQQAEAEAQRLAEEASATTRQTREEADAQAARRLQRAEDAAQKIIERAGSVDAELERLLEQLRTATGGVVETLETGAGQLRSQLTEIRAEYESVRGAESADGDGPPDAEPELVAEVRGTAPETPDASADEDYAEEREEPATEPEPEPDEEEPAVDEEPEPARSRSIRGAEGARLIALNMALNGTPRDETERYLEQNFDLEDQDSLLDEVYARVSN